MNRPLLRARLRWRIAREFPNGMPDTDPSGCHVVMDSKEAADRVLDRLSAEHGSGGLLDLLKNIDWVKLLEIILAVVQLFASSPQGACETEVDPSHPAGSTDAPVVGDIDLETA